MKTRTILLTLLIVSTLILAACSPPSDGAESMVDNSIVTKATDDSNQRPKAEMDDDELSMTDNNDTVSDQENNDMKGEMADDDESPMMKYDKTDMDKHDEEMTNDNEDGSMSEEGDEVSDDSMATTPNWFKIPLKDVGGEETFTINDLKGKVVLVETLAMWCSNCLKQQNQVRILHDLVGERDDFVSLGIDIDPNENSEALLVYITKNDFNWMYTVAPVEVAREIGQLYGDQFLNPPSTPMLIIDKDGAVHPLPFGIKSAEELQAALRPFFDGEM